jgi:polar amino acid transport system substrate-binding protein
MKKSMKIKSMMFLLATIYSVSAYGAKPKIIVGTNAVYAPLEYLDKKGKVIGFNTELITAILEKNGYEVVFNDMDFSGLLPSIVAGSVDIVGSTFTITSERKKKVDFTDSTLTGGLAIAYNTEKISNVKKAKDLVGRSLGCELGTTGCDETNKIKDAKVSVFNDTIGLMMALEAGKVDAIVADTIVNAYYARTTKNTKVVALQDHLSVEHYAFAVKKGTHKELLKQINATLKEMKKNGEYQALQKKYL